MLALVLLPVTFTVNASAALAPAQTPVRLAPLATSPRFAVINLGSLGGFVSSTAPASINDAGQVTGSALTAGGQEHGFRSAAGAPINPATDDLGTLGGTFSRPVSINNAGQIAGSSSLDGVNNIRAFRTGANQPIQAGNNLKTLLVFPGTPDGYGGATFGGAINDSGMVVGQGGAPNGQGFRAFRTTGSALVVETDHLGTLRPDPQHAGEFLGDSGARGVNDAGVVVGTSVTSLLLPGSQTSYQHHAFRHAGGGTLNAGSDDLGTLGGSYSDAMAINTAGQVVGTSALANGNVHAYRTSAGGAIQAGNDLGTLGGTSSFGLSINDNGQVVGESTTAGGATHAFLYENGEMLDLNSLIPANTNWTLYRATDINNHGQIVGIGSHGGFLLTPLPTADLAVTLTHDPEPVTVGQTVTWTLTVRNNGPQAAVGVSASFTLPSGATLVSSQPAVAPASGKLTYAVGPLANQGVFTATIVMTPTTPGTLNAGAAVTGGVSDGVPGNDTATSPATAVAAPLADLSVALSVATPLPIVTGQTLTYTAVVANSGPAAAAGVVFTDTLPAGVEYLSSGGTQGDFVQASGVVTGQLGTIASGQSVTIQIAVRPLTPSTLTNLAIVTATTPDPDEADLMATVQTAVGQGLPAPSSLKAVFDARKVQVKLSWKNNTKDFTAILVEADDPDDPEHPYVERLAKKATSHVITTGRFRLGQGLTFRVRAEKTGLGVSPLSSPAFVQVPAAGRLRLLSNLIEFGQVPIGRPSKRTFKIFNDGPGPQVIASIHVSSEGSPRTRVLDTVTNQVILPGKSITVRIEFRPTDTVEVVEGLMIFHQPGQLARITVTGRGFQN
jgi:uncharacterized repeat protein (TIGR01451 family)